MERVTKFIWVLDDQEQEINSEEAYKLLNSKRGYLDATIKVVDDYILVTIIDY